MGVTEGLLVGTGVGFLVGVEVVPASRAWTGGNIGVGPRRLLLFFSVGEGVFGVFVGESVGGGG